MSAFRLFGGRRRREAELREEIRSHLEMAVRDRVAGGESREEAEHAARREFGNELLVREVTSDMWGGAWLEHVAQDLRYAVRGLARSPGLTLGVMLTLGLGLGANAAVFSLLDRLFLREPGGVPHPEQVQRLYWTGRGVFGQPEAFRQFFYPVFRVIEGAAGNGAVVATYQERAVTLGPAQGGTKLAGVWAGAHYFEVLGLHAERGRFFGPDEVAIGSSAHVAVVSDAFWRGRLGGDPAVLGRTLELDKERYTIVGVAPPGFRGIDVDAADIWLPLPLLPWRGTDRWYETRNTGFLDVIARLRPGVAAPQLMLRATAAVDASERALGQWDSTVVLLGGPIMAARGPARHDESIPIAARLGAVALLVLLIACANVANLLLARALRRRREIAVRLALGVSRRRLMGQLLTEGLLLALLAGGGALLLGLWGGAVLRALLMPGTHWAGHVLGGHAVLAIIVAALACGLATGLVPALQATRPDVVAALKGGAREGSYRASRVRDGLIVVQSALSVVLLVGAGLFLRSLREVEGADIGYDADRLVFASISSKSFARDADGAAVLEQAAERLRRLPAVENVALASVAPMRGMSFTELYVPGRDSLPLSPYGVPSFTAVSPTFFTATGLRVVLGRGFRAADHAGAARVVVVNRTMARALWPSENAIGKCMRLEARTSPCTTVVGVVEDGRQSNVVEHATMLYYLPLAQAPSWASEAGDLILRAHAGRSAAVAAAAGRTLRALVPGGEPRVQGMAELLAPQYRPWRLGAGLLTALGLLALLVAAVGIYSVLANVFGQRRHELSVRIALGARMASIYELVLGEGLRLVVIGVIAGSLIALAAGRLVAAALYDTAPHDPVVMAGAALTLLATAVAASLIPARRAAAVDPAEELRAE